MSRKEALWAYIITLGVLSAFGFGVDSLFTGPWRSGSPPFLPAHVLVGPNNTFLADPGYGKLGTILCEEKSFTLRDLSNKDEEIFCTSREGAHSYRYPLSKVWEP